MSYHIESTELEGVLLIKPKIFEDERGRFRRTFCLPSLEEFGVPFEVKQCNLSENHLRHTLRGFHWQNSSESKILTCLTGEIYDIAVDLRPHSKTAGKWLSFCLSEENGYALRIPEGCANAWMTMKDHTNIHYWHSDIYRPEAEAGMRYNDPSFGFVWPAAPSVISKKDQSHPNYNLITS